MQEISFQCFSQEASEVSQPWKFAEKAIRSWVRRVPKMSKDEISEINLAAVHFHIYRLM